MHDRSRLPRSEDCIVRNLLIWRASEHPDREFVLFENGERWSYVEALAQVHTTASGFEALFEHVLKNSGAKLMELPKTPTQKIEKHVLRSAGVTADTWDRDAAGIEPDRGARAVR